MRRPLSSYFTYLGLQHTLKVVGKPIISNETINSDEYIGLGRVPIPEISTRGRCGVVRKLMRSRLCCHLHSVYFVLTSVRPDYCEKSAGTPPAAAGCPSPNLPEQQDKYLP